MESLKYLQELDKSSRQNIVAKAYNQIIKASAGLGTDVDAILAAIILINTPQEFSQLLKLFKDKKTGYDSFQNMINGEYDSLNYNDVVNIVNKLKSIGVTATFASGNAAGRFKIIKGNFKIIKIQPSLGRLKFETELNAKLARAKKFWRSWLADPITKKKVQANYATDPYGKKNVDAAFKSYEKMLENLKLEFYDNSMKVSPSGYPLDLKVHHANAFTNAAWTHQIIYVNGSRANENTDWYGTLLHEIQHIIYHIKPLNPDNKSLKAFASNTVTATEKSIKSELDGMYTINKSGEYELKPVHKQKQTLGPGATYKLIQTIKFNNPFMEDHDILYWVNELKERTAQSGRTYVCDDNELSSVIIRMKELFKIPPGDPVFPVNMLMPYIKLNTARTYPKKENNNVSWFLVCWAKKGFKPLGSLLNQINQLAVNKTKTSVSTSPEGQA